VYTAATVGKALVATQALLLVRMALRPVAVAALAVLTLPGAALAVKSASGRLGDRHEKS
jgi:hypothetical protein